VKESKELVRLSEDDSIDYYPPIPAFDWASVRESADKYAEGAVNVLEGVGRGLLLMVVPLVSIGVAIALSKILLKAPATVMVGDL
jgi:hypothetical protein